MKLTKTDIRQKRAELEDGRQARRGGGVGGGFLNIIIFFIKNVIQ